jgi:deferrochelatase/peroxidase EfeB
VKPPSQKDWNSNGAEPASSDRRRLLLGLGFAGGAVAGGLNAGLALAGSPNEPAQPEPGLEARQPFYGVHQSGVTTARQPAGLVVSFTVLGTTRGDLERLLRKLTERIEFLTQGGPAPQIDPKFPAPDSGLLGPVVASGNLTMTAALGASVFDDRFGLARVKPIHLERMPQFPNDALDAESCHGDLLLQICSETQETNIHALRDIVRNFPDLLLMRWKVEGYNAPSRAAVVAPSTPRNLLGFKDGTANPDANDDARMNRLVWITPESGEPAWTVGGSYQVVRIIRNYVERWDRTPLQEQQTIIGRDKMTGAPLAMASEQDIPDYANDPKGERIPLDAHIRLANPRTAATQTSLILRRGYNYSRGVTKAGQLDMGLLFICFQSNLQDGFVAVQNRLNGEPLEEYIKPVGGGFFFVLPGVPAKDRYLGQSLIEAVDPSDDRAQATPKSST